MLQPPVSVGRRRELGLVDTSFPYAIIDAEKEKIQRWSPIRNYWSDWAPTSVDQPYLIFTTNDALPKSEYTKARGWDDCPERMDAHPYRERIGSETEHWVRG